MLDQLLDLVKQFGKETVVENPEVPNEYNEDIITDATKTIGSGFQNIMAGGGFQNILDLFKGGGSTSNSAAGSGGWAAKELTEKGLKVLVLDHSEKVATLAANSASISGGIACGQPSRWTKETVPAISTSLPTFSGARAAMASAIWAPSDQPTSRVCGCRQAARSSAAAWKSAIRGASR